MHGSLADQRSYDIVSPGMDRHFLAESEREKMLEPSEISKKVPQSINYFHLSLN
jgi:hypothetical protein